MTAVKRWLAAIFLLLAAILSGSLAMFLRPVMWSQASFGITLIGLVVLALYDEENYNLLWLAGLLGLLCDSFYFGFFGVCLVSFPVLTFLTQKLARYIPEIAWTKMLVALVAYLIQYLYLFLILAMFNLGNVSRSAFWQGLGASCLSGIFWIVLTFWLWRKVAQKFPFLPSQADLY
ncbi:MAG: rod shape-determining protein MreD [Lactobacillus sp.]|jgi:rod shape-determining protein MreD|nr:rod shape-determining protein MreD [Lactobacillus sp.]MCH4069355.1 rod shape-determining protein MreD [Lactobacillus sp.]MCI1303657.1 rod shape-determining protein MreD [Lactobacillus sp.]MCI1329834.1 rod shape-determining protein MreD [Lactobacillus sp.]MCI1359510.1 rod shape-determining protein MreD [Lactobacillus sp.]